jgi:hypothetical protein
MVTEKPQSLSIGPHTAMAFCRGFAIAKTHWRKRKLKPDQAHCSASRRTFTRLSRSKEGKLRKAVEELFTTFSFEGRPDTTRV